VIQRVETRDVIGVSTCPAGKFGSQKEGCGLKPKKRKGTYVLIILVSEAITTVVGQLGKQELHSGYYSYVGSATGGRSVDLQSRVSRHLRKEKTKHWHIDYLLSEDAARIVSIIVIPSDENVECEVNQRIRDELNAKTTVKKFGASDCTKKCGSHLLYFPHAASIDLLTTEILDLLRPD